MINTLTPREQDWLHIFFSGRNILKWETILQEGVTGTLWP